MALSKATLIAVLALAFTVLSVHAAAPMSAPAPAPTAAAAGIYPSLGSVFVAAIVSLFLGYGLKIWRSYMELGNWVWVWDLFSDEGFYGWRI